MAIERPLEAGPFSSEIDPEILEQEVEVEVEDNQPDLSIGIVNPDAVSIQTEDGGVIIDFDPQVSDMKTDDHTANLAEMMSENQLQEVATELVGYFESDSMSRKDWEMTYIKGLDLLGLKIEDRTQPFPRMMDQSQTRTFRQQQLMQSMLLMMP